MEIQTLKASVSLVEHNRLQKTSMTEAAWIAHACNISRAERLVYFAFLYFDEWLIARYHFVYFLRFAVYHGLFNYWGQVRMLYCLSNDSMVRLVFHTGVLTRHLV